MIDMAHVSLPRTWGWRCGSLQGAHVSPAPFGACQKSRICRRRVVVSAPLGFGARLDSGCPSSPKLHLDRRATRNSICIIVRIPSKPTKSFHLPRTTTSALDRHVTLSSSKAAGLPHATATTYYLEAAVPIHVVAIIPNVRSPTFEDRLSPFQKCRDKGGRPPVKVLPRRLPPSNRASSNGTCTCTLLQHIEASHNPPRSQHSEPARSMVQPDLSLCKHHATLGPGPKQTPR